MTLPVPDTWRQYARTRARRRAPRGCNRRTRRHRWSRTIPRARCRRSRKRDSAAARSVRRTTAGSSAQSRHEPRATQYPRPPSGTPAENPTPPERHATTTGGELLARLEHQQPAPQPLIIQRRDALFTASTPRARPSASRRGQRGPFGNRRSPCRATAPTQPHTMSSCLPPIYPTSGITSDENRSISSSCGLDCRSSRSTPASTNARTRSATCSGVPASPARKPRFDTE